MEKLKQLSLAMKCVILGIVAVVLVAVLLLIVFTDSGKDTLEVQSALKDVIKISELRTVEYTYNSIAKAIDGDEIKYYVAYSGKAVATLNFDDIEFEQDEDIIYIKVPDPDDIKIELGTDFEFLFTKKKYETENVIVEAKRICEEDLAEKVKNNSAVKDAARESAKNTLNALMKPFEKQLPDGQRFDIVFVTAEGEVK